MGLERGAKLTLTLKSDGSLEVSPFRLKASALFGLLASPGEVPLSLAEIEDAVEMGLAEDALK